MYAFGDNSDDRSSMNWRSYEEEKQDASDEVGFPFQKGEWILIAFAAKKMRRERTNSEVHKED
jgi:hypothetical protein